VVYFLWGVSGWFDRQYLLKNEIDVSAGIIRLLRKNQENSFQGDAVDERNKYLAKSKNLTKISIVNYKLSTLENVKNEKNI